jgi:hypothetical protein
MSKSFFAGVALLLGVAACGGKGGVEGTWTVDANAMVDLAVAEMKARGNVVTPEQRAGIATMFKDVKMELTFKGDGTASATMGGMPGASDETMTGTWTQSGDVVTVTTKTKNGKPAEGEDAKAQPLVLKDGKLTMTKDGRSITFVRK